MWLVVVEAPRGLLFLSLLLVVVILLVVECLRFPHPPYKITLLHGKLQLLLLSLLLPLLLLFFYSLPLDNHIIIKSRLDLCVGHPSEWSPSSVTLLSHGEYLDIAARERRRLSEKLKTKEKVEALKNKEQSFSLRFRLTTCLFATICCSPPPSRLEKKNGSITIRRYYIKCHQALPTPPPSSPSFYAAISVCSDADFTL